MGKSLAGGVQAMLTAAYLRADGKDELQMGGAGAIRSRELKTRGCALTPIFKPEERQITH
jgi:hypothetical protein